MADSLLSLGVEKLCDLLVRESERFQGVEDQLDELKRELNMLRCFLKDADAKKHSSETLKETVKEIKEIVYDAEDIIETFLRKEELGETNGTRKRIKQLACVIAERRGLSFDMKAISDRIAKVIRNMKIDGVQQFTINERDTQSLQEEMRQTFSSDSEDHLVGLEKNVEQLVSYLVEEANSNVVSIIGMGGVGKTTLARQVFNHEMVKNHFDGVAWVCISQQFKTEDVWQSILEELSSKPSNLHTNMLHKELLQLLETSNSLIVLDDMWKEEDWDRIKHVFPSKKGYKVLLTSRNENVAFHVDPECVVFKPKCLTPEESWTLFQRIAFPRKDTSEFKVDIEMEDMGKQMIIDCGGLPLAVKVLGSLLAPKHTLKEWKRVYENIGSHIVGGNTVSHILSLSFEELPIYLKHCFLYLAHFREDYLIDVEGLSYYWAAEEVPRPRCYDGKTIREVADGFVEELVKRNMVISKRDDRTSRFKTCHLHNIMREVCLLKAEEENFVQKVDATATSQSPCNSRRIAVHKVDDTSPPKWEMLNPKLRSLLIIEDYRWENWRASGLSFTKVQLMRVLDLSYANFEGGKLPSSIGKLIHLRYLSLRRAQVADLPSSMRSLKMLLYLNLDVKTGGMGCKIPNFLNEMRELAFLYLPDDIHNNVKLEICNLVNLETLRNFSTKHSSVRDLQRMTRLETLSIVVNDKGLSIHDPMPILEKLLHLKKVKLMNRSFVGREMVCSGGGFPQLQKLKLFGLVDLEEWIVEEGSMPLLHTLKIWGCSKLKQLTFGGFPQLQKLEVCGLYDLEEWIVEEGSMPLLQFLRIWICPNLKRLPVCEFSQLQDLQLEGLNEWEEWILEEGSMPLLHSLTIHDCSKLKQLPYGLQFIYSLKELRMDNEWKTRLSGGGQEYYKIQHIPIVQFYHEEHMEYETMTR